MISFGKVTARKNKLYFNSTQWALIKEFAQKAHKSPKQIVVAALKRGVRNAEKTKNARD